MSKLRRTGIVSILVMFAFLAAIGAEQSLGAENKDPRENVANSKRQIPDSAQGIWKEIDKRQADLTAAVKANKTVKGLASDLRELVKALPAKAQPDHKKHVETLGKRVMDVIDDLEKSGNVGDQAQTETHLKRLANALKALRPHSGGE